MKKKNKSKAGAKKEDKDETEEIVADTAKPEATAEIASTPTTPDIKEDEPKDEGSSESKDAAETVSELNHTHRARQPSLSLQSKMRSSSFRQSAGGPLSPGYGFSPEGDTAPDIYRKQALRIEELEKENKRLAKEATDGERRWKKAEEELEELREAEDDSTTQTKEPSSSAGSSDELEKLVLISSCVYSLIANHCPEV